MLTVTGDKSGNRPIFTDEANEESRKFNRSPASIFDVDGNCRMTAGLESSQAIYDLTRAPHGKDKAKEVPKSVVDEFLNELTMDLIVKYMADTKSGPAKYKQYDIVKLNDYKHGFQDGKKSITTTLGRLLFNTYVMSEISSPFYNVIITKGKWSSMLKEEGNKVLTEGAEDGVVKFKKMLARNEELSFKISPLIATTIDITTFALSDKEKNTRKQILKKYQKEIDNGNIDAMENFENEVVDYMLESRKDDPYLNVTNSGVKVKFGGQPKMGFVSVGTMPTDIGEYQSTPNSLLQGYRKKDITMFAKSGIVSGYYRAVAPADGGAMAKVMIAGVQTTYIDKFGTDCGTKDTQPILITKGNMSEAVGRYMQVSGKDVLITYDNVKELVDRVVKFRSPIMCENNDLCNKCVGNKVYDVLGKDKKIPFGLFLTTLGEQVVQKALKKVHVNKAQFVRIDPNKMLTDISTINKNKNVGNSNGVTLMSQVDSFDSILDNMDTKGLDDEYEIREAIEEIIDDEFAIRELASKGFLKISDADIIKEGVGIEQYSIADEVNVVVEIETDSVEDKGYKECVDKFVDVEPSDPVILKTAAWYLLDRASDYFDKVSSTTENNMRLEDNVEIVSKQDYVSDWYKNGAIEFMYKECQDVLNSDSTLVDLINNSPIIFEEQSAKGFYIMKLPFLALDTDKITLSKMPNSINDMGDDEYPRVMKQLEIFIQALDSNADILMEGTTLDIRMDNRNLINVILEYPLPIIIEDSKDKFIREAKKSKPDPKKLKMNAIIKDITDKKKESIKALLTEGSGIKGAIKADYGQKFASVKADLESQFSDIKAKERDKINKVLAKLFEKMELGHKKNVLKARNNVYKGLDKMLAKVDKKTQGKIDKLKDKIQSKIDKVKAKFTD